MTERATVTYTGDEPIVLGGSCSPQPAGANAAGDVIGVDATFVDALVARRDFTAGGELRDLTADIPEPRPVDNLPDTDLAGAALDDALADAGLVRTGSADEKRARLAEWVTAQGGTPTPTPNGA